ncbi:MAG: sigma-70 family RNA polymerase sigma factor [Tannerella sp.]|jgi:RNA polymerase sigma-70 factor (ECF subfamily)|nr:sigma-70 family RNA polymerase sigma factor [Tannerella sp.]
MESSITEQYFERLFRDNYTRLYYYSFDILRDTEASKDAVNDIFAAVWNERERMDSKLVVGYMLNGVRNICLNQLRKRQKSEDYVEFCLQVFEEEGNDGWEDLENRLSEMKDVIARMPPRTRLILEECYYHDKKYREVAEMLGITLDGVKKHIVKAFALLREHFNVKK